MVDRDDDARKAHDDRVKRAAVAKEADLKAHKERQDDQAKVNAEVMRKQDESRPTPTQEENDLARLGHPVMDKEDDGSGPDRVPNPALSADEQKRQADEAKRRTAKPAGGAAPYATRDSAAKI
jgi:hypothetical protein